MDCNINPGIIAELNIILDNLVWVGVRLREGDVVHCSPYSAMWVYIRVIH